MEFQAAGLKASLDSNDAIFVRSFKQAFFAALSGGAPTVNYSVSVDRRDGPKKHVATRDGELVVITSTYRSLLPALEIDIAKRIVEQSPSRRYVRGSLVSSQGVGILILDDEPAAGGWLVKALVERGAQFHAQGMTILDYPETLALPFVKGIGLVTPGNPLATRETQRRAKRERPGDFVRYWNPCPTLETTPEGRQEIHCILVSTKDRADPPRLSPMDKGDALDSMLGNIYKVGSWEEEILPYAIDIVQKASCYYLTRGITDSTVSLILQCAESLRRS